MDANKYNDLIVELVQNCTKEMIYLMKERGLKMVDFVEHDVELPSSVFEDDFNGEYSYEDIESISIDKDNNLIISGEHLSGYLDGTYGDYFKVADSIGHIYRALIECFERVDNGWSKFAPEEYEDKCGNGVTPEEWNAIVVLMELDAEDSKNIKSMNVVESNDDFDYIYIDFNDKYAGANYCVLRKKDTKEIFMPTSCDLAYPATIADINLYAWVNSNGKKIQFNNENKMEDYNGIVNERLVYLNKNFPDIFDGITFVWHKNHTMCVKSKRDERNGDTKTSYVAIYKHHGDIVPIKLSRMEKLDVEFPPLS